MAITNSSDMSHIVRTTEQWVSSYDKSEIIPLGVLCVEITSSKATRIKIGDGHSTFSKLPYVGGGSQSSSDDTILQILRDNYVMSIKGNTSSLPSSASCGDVWFVRDNSSSSIKYTAYVYSPNHTWVQLGGSSSETDLTEITKYIDDKIEEVNQKIDEINEEENHIHDNKEILDLITAPFTAEEKAKLESLSMNTESSTQNHTHKNKDILDLIDDPFTSEDRRKLDKLNNYDDSLLKEKISALEKLSHEHSNKRVLDRTTAAFTLDYEKKMRWIRQYVGSDGMNEGIMGLVPPAAVGEEDYVLSGSGEWIPIEGLVPYELPIATDEMLGGVKIGDGIDISEDGTISVDLDFKYDLVWVTEGDAIEVVKKPIPGNKTIDILQECTTWSHQEYSMVTSADYSSAAPGLLSTARANISDGYMILPSDHTRFIVDVKAKNGKELKVRMSNMSDTTATHFDIIRIDHGHRSDIKYFDPGEIMSPSYTYEGASFNRYHRYMLTIRWAENKDLINTPLNPSDLEYFTITYLDEDYENPIGTENVVNVKYGDGLSLDEEGKLKVDFPIATTETLGGVIVGEGLQIDETGILDIKYDATTLTINENNELTVINEDEPVYSAGDGISIDKKEISIVPSEYQMTSYNASNASSAFDTGYVFTSRSRLELCVEVLQSGSGWQFLYGSRDTSMARDIGFAVRHWDNGWKPEIWVNGAQTLVSSNGINFEYNKKVILIHEEGMFKWKLEESVDFNEVPISKNIASSGISLAILAMRDEYNQQYDFYPYANLYYAKIYEDDELIHSFIPCYLKSDSSKVGFYDVITGDFKTSVSSIKFTNGPDVIDPSTEVKQVISAKIGEGLSIDEEGKIKVDFPIATTETLGEVIVGDGLVIDENGVISVDESIKHPPIKAGIGIDITQDEETKEDIISVKYSSGLNINEDNELFVDGKEDTIPRFTKEEYEQAVIDGTAPPPGSLFIITDDEEEPDPPEYELPIASDEVLGGIRVGEGLIIDENGVLSVGNIHASQVDMKDYRPADEYTPITESDNVSTAIGKLDIGLISKEDKIPRFTKEEYEQAVLDGTAPKPGELFIITDDINPLDPYGVIDVKTTENEVGKLDIIKNAETKTIDIFEYLESLTLNCVTDDSSI